MKMQIIEIHGLKTRITAIAGWESK